MPLYWYFHPNSSSPLHSLLHLTAKWKAKSSFVFVYIIFSSFFYCTTTRWDDLAKTLSPSHSFVIIFIMPSINLQKQMENEPNWKLIKESKIPFKFRRFRWILSTVTLGWKSIFQFSLASIFKDLKRILSDVIFQTAHSTAPRVNRYTHF